MLLAEPSGGVGQHAGALGVLVDLDEGARVITDMVDSQPEDVAVGMAVEVLFDPVTEDFTVPRFRLADATEAAR